MQNNQQCFDRDSKKVKPLANSLLLYAPEIAAEWHPTKNGFFRPNNVTRGAKLIVFWLCKKGHEYKASVNQRTNISSGCPYCAGKKALPGYNDFSTVFPQIAVEWHPTKNGELTPSDVTWGSAKKVWWLCKKGHEYEASINNRIRAIVGCPYCANKKALPGYNDLSTTCPQIANEWHPTKNGILKPSDVLKGSSEKVWWLCKNGHAYESSIYDRTSKNYGCPYCSGHKLLLGYNDLATTYPKIAAEWHPTKNGTLKPTDVTKSSKSSVWWLCPNKHEYYAVIKNRTINNSSCPYCTSKKVLPGYNDLATTWPKIAAEWHPTLNHDLLPSGVTKGAGTVVWWLCENGHEYKARIVQRTGSGAGCPYCAGKKVRPGDNDLLSLYPEIASEWHPTKNGNLTPSDVTKGCNTKVWWLCKNGHEFEAVINKRTRSGSGCPYCAENKVQPGDNDLLSLYPEIAAEWHPTKNGNLTPSDVTKRCGIKVWWLCENGHEFEAEINRRIGTGSRCPFCAGNRIPLEKSLAYLYPELLKEWDYVCNYVICNPDEISPVNDKCVFWKCPNNSIHVYSTSTHNRVNLYNRGKEACPFCKGFRRKKSHFI